MRPGAAREYRGGMVGMDLLSKVCYTKNTHFNTMEGGRKGGLDNITQPWS